MIAVRYDRGVELPDFGLWLDPHDAKPFAFVSHAHSDHLGAHAEVILSRGTSALMKERMPGKRLEHVMAFGEKLHRRDFGITLIPAGHIFGSAQGFVEGEQGSLLYTGDFKLRPGLSAERTQWCHADTLIMETTYGLPRYRMPPTDETIANMVEFCHDALEEGAVPILLGYSLGKSQEILCALIGAGLTPMLHDSVWRLTEIYRRLQPEFPCTYTRYNASEVVGKVLICPPSATRWKMITQLKHKRTAVLTGWALDPGAIYRYQCDAAFPLTDHADYPDLLRYVELVQPKRVLTLHGFAVEFARDLRERGVEAWALTAENQLELAFVMPRAKEEESVKGSGVIDDQSSQSEGSSSAVSFASFAQLGDRIARTASKLRKIEFLSDYLRRLDSASLPVAAVFLSGRAFPQSDRRVLQTGWAVIKRALLAVSGIGEVRLREISRAHADAGKVAYEALLQRTKPEPATLLQIQEFYSLLSAARGPQQKTELLQNRLATLTPIEASTLIKILTGDLRIGLKESLVEDAIARAFNVPAEEVREANMFLGDSGEVASLAQSGGLATAGIRVFRPIKCMLASPEPSAEAIWDRIGTSGLSCWIEDKYDGIRAQVHVADSRVGVYTRDLRDVTGQFADLVRSARALTEHRAIFDGEILAFSEGKKLTFFDLQKRLGRKTEDDLFLGASDVPVIFRAFDLLWLDGETLLRTPLRKRREMLESIPLPSGLEVAPKYPFANATDLEAAFHAARRRGNEGLIIKDAASHYTPGRRGLAWLKLKQELATLDVVVVAAEQGHGKRSQVLSDYTFAVRDDGTGALLTIGKAYSGLTDLEIEELTEHFTATTLVNHGRYREVRPEIVLEIAFDSIQPSNRHESGLAMRFPRIKAIRRDKTVADIDSLSYARSLVSK
jgi:ATP-dependent DNA ligase I